MIRLENVLKISFQDFLKMSSKRFCKTSWKRLEDALKTSWRRLEDVWPRRINWSWPRRLEDILKTSSEDVWIRRICSSWSRRLLKTKTKDVFKTSSRRLHQDECLLGNSYQQACKVLFTFVPNKQFGQLITISTHLLTVLNTTNAELQSIQLWFTDQNNRPLEIEDTVNITLIIG